MVANCVPLGMRLLNFTRRHWLAIAIIIMGIFVRVYNLPKIAGFDFDQETAAIWVKHFLIDHKISLIGQEVSVGGIYTGPGYNYLLSFFYFVFQMNPLAGNFLQLIISLFTMIIIYRLGKLPALAIYAFSSGLVSIDQAATPSNPLLFFGSLSLLFSGSLGAQVILTGLGWHFHPTTLFLTPIGLWQSRERIKILNRKNLLACLIITLVFFSPLVIFDFRHDFLDIKNTIRLFSGSGGSSSYPLIFRFIISTRVMLEGLLSIINIQGRATSLIVTSIAVGLFWKSFKSQLAWFAVPVLLMSFYPKTFPEYYFYLAYPAFVVSLGLIFTTVLSKNLMWRSVAIFIFVLFLISNLSSIFSRHNSYAIDYKMAAVDAVVKEANRMGKPASLKIISDPGQGNGFSYLMWWKTGRENESVTAPTATVFLPSSLSKKSGKIFGTIKVITNERQ
jgi:hypothetical protein